MTNSAARQAAFLIMVLTVFRPLNSQAQISDAAQRSFEVYGRITVEGGGPVPVAEITFDETSGQKFEVTRSQFDGTFVVALTEGEWRPHVKPMLEGYDVVSLNTPVRVVGSEIPEIAITLASRQPGLKVGGRIVSSLAASGVKVFLNSGWLKMETMAQADGSFEFLQVPKGPYQIDSSDYRPLTTILVDRDITDLDIRQSWTVEGRVITTDNVPEPHVTVLLHPVPLSNSPPQDVGPFWPHEKFDMYVPAGEYRVEVRDIPPAYKLRSITFGSLDLRKETLKVVGELRPQEPVQLTFEPVKPQYARISGRVVPPKGEGAYMRTLGVVLTSSNWSYSTAVDAEGRFEFPKVLRGNYRVFATPNGPLRNLTVNRKEMRDVEIVLPKLRQIRGRVRVLGDYPFPRAWYEAITRGMRPVPGNGVTTQQDGTFALTIPEGQHAFEVTGYAAPYRIQSIQFGKVDLVKAPLIIDRATNDEIVVTFEVAPSPSFKVAGQFLGTERLPAGIHSVKVVLESEFPVVLDASLSAGGLFEFPRVAPGAYVLTTQPRIFGLLGTTIVVSDHDVSRRELRVPEQRQVIVRLSGDPSPSGYTFFVKDSEGRRYQIIANSSLAIALGRTDFRCLSDVCSPAPMGLLINEPRVVSGTAKQFTIDVAEGDYPIEIGFAGSYTLQSLQYGATSLLQDPLRLRGQGPHEIVVTFGPR